MVAGNFNDGTPSAGRKQVPPVRWLTDRVRNYFDRHPEVSRDEFLLDALSREMDCREQRERWNGAGFAGRQDKKGTRWSTARPRPSPEEIHLHAWLSERLAILHHERHGLWPKLGRSLFGNRLARWLGFQSQ
jgi:hypothetical protein